MGDPQFDPFEPGFDAWPYDQYRRLREAGTVQWSELLCGWLLTGYDDVTRILRDKTVSSDLNKAKPSAVVDLLRSRGGDEPSEPTSLVLTDEPAHGRLRKALAAPFTARSSGCAGRSRRGSTTTSTAWSPSTASS
jgi:cytochrome P450